MHTHFLAAIVAAFFLVAGLNGAEPKPKPGIALNQRLIAQLIKSLESDDFDEREMASALLLRIGQPAVQPLKNVMAGKPSLELASRASGILQKLLANQPGLAIRRQLTTRINLPRGIDPGTPLKDAIEFLNDQHQVNIIIDAGAFEKIGVQKPEEQSVQLPPLANVPFETILRLLVRQVRNGRHSGTFIVRATYVEVTTTGILYARGNLTGPTRRDLPVVVAKFELDPLAEALRIIADQTDTTIVLDRRVGEKARRLVTANFRGVHIDTAVRLLANMADLHVAAIDNVLYVTTKKNAAEMEAEWARNCKPTQEVTPAKPPKSPATQPAENKSQQLPNLQSSRPKALDEIFKLQLANHPGDCDRQDLMTSGYLRRMRMLTGQGEQKGQ